MTSRQSRTLSIKNGSTCCRNCGYVLSPQGTSWKKATRISIRKVKNIPGSTPSTHHDVEIRHFSCPSCATLLDSETALPEDPYLDDIVF